MQAESNLFLDAAVLLGGTAIAAPLFKRIGLGTVLGYLAVGVLLGPVLDYRNDGEEVLHVAELGVVLLLFIVGLELKPALLWQRRKEILGLGFLQVTISGLVIFLGSWWWGFAPSTALVIGFGLALSSTAFALQLLEDSGDDRTTYGKRAFSILLFQDLAIAPLLIAIPLLAAGQMDVTGDGLQSIAIAIGCVVALILAGRYLLDPLFGLIVSSGARDAMIAASLFIVIAAALLMQFAGLSMAMGAFIAGVMLAESSYRHELEANIEPFRGILLGLFFVAVGLAVDLNVVWDNIFWIAICVPLAMSVKATVIYGLCRVFGSPHNDAVRVAFLLPQHGEFGFVLFSAAASAALLEPSQSSFLIACVTLSMAATPLVVRLGELFVHKDAHESMDEDFHGADGSVLMIGFSRMGQVTAQVLLTGGCKVTVLDMSAKRVRQAQKFGFRIYFGDGTRKDVLRAAGIEKADFVAVTTNSRETTDEIVDLIASEFPHVKQFVRAYDRGHSLSLLAKSHIWQIRETFESALEMGRALLRADGYEEEAAELMIQDVRQRDLERLQMQLTDGLMAGNEKLHYTPVPEPLAEPLHRTKRSYKLTREELAEGSHPDADEQTN